MGEAARLAGVSKTSIRRSLDAGRLSGAKDEFGRWRIDPAELQRAYPDAGAAQPVTLPEPHDASALRAEAALLREALERERERARDIAAERDAWRQQADAWRVQATALLPPPDKSRENGKGDAPADRPPRPWWRRWRR